MKQEFYDAITDNPIIAAVKDETGLKNCLKMPDTTVVFVLFGEVGTIADIVDCIKTAGKMAVVHVDLIAGLSSREEAVNFLAKYTKADGIISTRVDMIKRARELQLSTVYRIFAIDSKVLDKVNHRILDYADAVEILPGLMPKIIKKMVKLMPVPIIAGGLISDKEDVLQALDAGALAISSTKEEVWSM